MARNQKLFAAILLILLVGGAPLIWLFTHDDTEHHSHSDEHEHHSSSLHVTHNVSVKVDLVAPLPTTENINKSQAKIGWLLFKDPQLSSNGQISCESCHDLSSNGAEPTAVSTGVDGAGPTITEC